ncbi:hypothetical protein ABZP36_011142 [Zizania latifolia]
MGDRNRAWQRRGRHDRTRRRPPHPPPSPPCSGYSCHPVPLWEREFCIYIGGISWQRFCENKKYVSMYKNIDQWDDSEAFDNFKNAKARFWANYHDQPSDIPLPDPDMYIDKVDHNCKIDPELVADLDIVQLPFEWDNELLPADGVGNTSANNKCDENQSGNWDIYVEKPAEVNRWEENSRSNLSWGAKHESLNKWSKNGSGWGGALAHTSWGNWSSNNHYSSNNRDCLHGVSSNRYQDPRSISGRKRNSGGYFQQRNCKQRNQAEGYQRSGWGEHSERNSEWPPFDNRANGQRIERSF